MAYYNQITNNTAYVTFDTYDTVTGNKLNSFDIVKVNVTSIQSYYYEKTGNVTGAVTITTISQVPQIYKANGILQLIPSEWAPSTASTTPFTDAATLRTTLLSYFSSKW